MAGEKRSQEREEALLASAVLVDIEGTTTSINFVKVTTAGRSIERKGVRERERERGTKQTGEKASREFDHAVSLRFVSSRLGPRFVRANFLDGRKNSAGGGDCSLARTPPPRNSLVTEETAVSSALPSVARMHSVEFHDGLLSSRAGVVCRRLESSFRAIATHRLRHYICESRAQVEEKKKGGRGDSSFGQIFRASNVPVTSPPVKIEAR